MASQSGGGEQIESTIGKGTTVSVYFPRAAVELTTDLGPPASLSCERGSWRPNCRPFKSFVAAKSNEQFDPKRLLEVGVSSCCT